MGQELESLRARHFGTELGTPKPADIALEAATSASRRTQAFRTALHFLDGGLPPVYQPDIRRPRAVLPFTFLADCLS
jgi:hypothetical protein